MTEAVEVVVVAQLGTAIVMAAGFLFQYVMEGRRHRWALAQQADIAMRLAANVQTTAQDLLDHNGKTAAVLATQTSLATARLEGRLQDLYTQISVIADQKEKP